MVKPPEEKAISEEKSPAKSLKAPEEININECSPNTVSKALDSRLKFLETQRIKMNERIKT